MQRKPQSLIWGEKKKCSVSVVCRPQHISNDAGFFFSLSLQGFFSLALVSATLHQLYLFIQPVIFPFQIWTKFDPMFGVKMHSDPLNQTWSNSDNWAPLKWKSYFCGSRLQRVSQCQNISFSCWKTVFFYFTFFMILQDHKIEYLWKLPKWKPTVIMEPNSHPPQL